MLRRASLRLNKTKPAADTVLPQNSARRRIASRFGREVKSPPAQHRRGSSRRRADHRAVSSASRRGSPCLRPFRECRLLEIRRGPRRPKHMVADLGLNVGRRRAPADHQVSVGQTPTSKAKAPPTRGRKARLDGPSLSAAFSILRRSATSPRRHACPRRSARENRRPDRTRGIGPCGHDHIALAAGA